MSNTFLERHRPTRLYVVIAVLAVALVIAVGLVVVTVGDRSAPSATPTSAQAPSPDAAAGVPGPLRLVQGARVIDGVRVGYPRSNVGAVSAAVEYWTQIASTLDPSRAGEIGQVIADPSWRNAPAELAQGPVRTREGLGLPSSGPVPEGASVVLSAVSYQLRDVSADSITVLLLADYIVTLPGTSADTRTGVFPAQLHWSGNDWKILNSDSGPDYSGLKAEPGSPQAAALGWQLFQR